MCSETSFTSAVVLTFEFAVKVTRSYLTLCNPMDYIVHGILQARILEWVPFPFSKGSFQPRDRTQVSCIASRFFTSWATSESVKTYGPLGFPGGSVVKDLPANAGDMGSVPHLGRSHMPVLLAPQLLSLCSKAQERQLLNPHTIATKTCVP